METGNSKLEKTLLKGFSFQNAPPYPPHTLRLSELSDKNASFFYVLGISAILKNPHFLDICDFNRGSTSFLKDVLENLDNYQKIKIILIAKYFTRYTVTQKLYSNFEEL